MVGAGTGNRLHVFYWERWQGNHIGTTLNDILLETESFHHATPLPSVTM